MSRPGGALWDFLIKTRRFETSSRSRDVQAILRCIPVATIASRVPFLHTPYTHPPVISPVFSVINTPGGLWRIDPSRTKRRTDKCASRARSRDVRTRDDETHRRWSRLFVTHRAFPKTATMGISQENRCLGGNALHGYETGRVRVSLVWGSRRTLICISVHRSPR